MGGSRPQGLSVWRWTVASESAFGIRCANLGANSHSYPDHHLSFSMADTKGASESELSARFLCL